MTREISETAQLENGFDDILSPTSLQPQRASILSNKLTSVLAGSFADAEIQEALSELDERNVKNTAALRRRLRTDLQKDVIDCNGDIVKDFGLVASRLKRIGTIIASLERCCQDMRMHVSAAQRETAPVLQEAETLVVQKQDAETRQQLLTAFNKHFSPGDEELEVLSSSDLPVDELFFSLLMRLKSIHADCEALLGSDDQQLGIELMERSSKQLDTAFQKLFRWIQREFKHLDLENPRMSIPIRRALRVLAERPALFEACLDYFADARERNLSEAFYSALTGFSTQTDDHSTKPLDYYAHDPLRFVGDMLAWTHSAAVSERESLEVLFISEGNEMVAGIRAGLESEPWHKSGDGKQLFDGKAALKQLVNRDMNGVARALRQRVEQVVKSDDDAVLAYKVAHLIDFYRITFERLLGGDSAIVSVLFALHGSAMSQFRSVMHEYAQALPQGMAFETPEDLSTPEFLLDAIDRLQQFMKTFDASFTSDGSRELEFASTLELCLDPYLQACRIWNSEADSQLSEPAYSIFSLNVFKNVMPALAHFDFVSNRRAEIQKQVAHAQQRLAKHQFSFFMKNSGLQALHKALSGLSTDIASDIVQVANLAPCQPAELAVASQTLDEFLPEALVEAQEELRLLQDKGAAEGATSEAAGWFCEVFDQVEDILIAADEMAWSEKVRSSAEVTGDSNTSRDSEISRLRHIFPRTGAEIRVLLS